MTPDQLRVSENEVFEEIGDLYYARFHRLRPGKSEPIGSYRSSMDEDNLTQFNEWRGSDALYEAAEKLVLVTRAHAAALEEVSRIERLVYVPGAWKCAKCNLRLITTTLDAGSGRMAADCSPQECANGCGPMWRVTERDAGNDLVDRLDRAEAALAYVRKTLDEARPGMDEGAPIEAIVRKVVSALAESERRAERLEAEHYEALLIQKKKMQEVIDYWQGIAESRADKGE